MAAGCNPLLLFSSRQEVTHFPSTQHTQCDHHFTNLITSNHNLNLTLGETKSCTRQFIFVLLCVYSLWLRTSCTIHTNNNYYYNNNIPCLIRDNGPHICRWTWVHQRSGSSNLSSHFILHDTLETTFLFQSISVAIQHFNAVIFANFSATPMTS